MTGGEVDEIVATIISYLQEASEEDATIVHAASTGFPGEFEVLVRVFQPRGHDDGVKLTFRLVDIEQGGLR